MIQHPECCCKRRPFQLFDETIKEGIKPGLLEEAENLIEMTHLGACIASSPSTIVERIAKKVMELKPNYLGYLIN